MGHSAYHVWNRYDTGALKIPHQAPSNGTFKSVNPLCGTQLYRGCMSYILYVKNNKRPMPICKYYFEIFLLLFVSAGREAVQIEGIITMYADAFEGRFRLSIWL